MSCGRGRIMSCVGLMYFIGSILIGYSCEMSQATKLNNTFLE